MYALLSVLTLATAQFEHLHLLKFTKGIKSFFIIAGSHIIQYFIKEYLIVLLF